MNLLPEFFSFEWRYVGGEWVVLPVWQADPRSAEGPKNNDGRKSCYWCGADTKTIPLATSLAQVCSKCGR